MDLLDSSLWLTRVEFPHFVGERASVASDGGAARWASAAELASHFLKHGPKLGLVSESEYDASGRATMRAGMRFTYEDPGSGGRRVGYFDRRSGLFTALTGDETIILTHFLVDEAYVRNLPDSTYA